MDIIIPIDSEKGIIRKFFDLTGRLLLEPARFFRQDMNLLSWEAAVTFGITGAWLATFISFFWDTLNSLFLVQFFEQWVQKFFATEEAISFLSQDGNAFVWSAAFLLLTPFLLLLRLVFSSSAMYVFAKLLIEPNERALEPVTYAGILRIFAVALTGTWFAVVPIFGAPLAFVARLVFAVTGMKERYGISTRRSLAVVLAPYIFLGLVLLLFVAVGLLLLAQMPIQDLLNLDQGM